MLRLVSLILLASAALRAQPQQEDWTQLFNGRNLDGWTPKITKHAYGDNYANTFRVKDGMLTVNYDGYQSFDEQFGHIFYKEPFSHYIIAVEYRFVGEQAPKGPGWAIRNSGIMVHCQDPKTMGKDQDFPISIEVQLLGGAATGERTTANLCTPGTNVVYQGKFFTPHCLNSTSETYRGDQWVRVEAEVHGDSIVTHRVNGKTVLTYEMPQIGGGNVIHFDPAAKKDGMLLQGGYISLQSESHPVEFRKVELLNLVGCTDPKAKNYRKHYLKPDPQSCQYQ